jgi:predicted Zn-ribbon and HTH transcriptional regulator
MTIEKEYMLITQYYTMIIEELECKRCGGKWLPRSENIPVQCPRCHSVYWNRDRVYNIRKEK